jgi:hypothetical protein
MPQVALRFLDEIRMGESEDPAAEGAMKKKIAVIFSVAHLSVSNASGRMLLELRRHNYVTPTNYLEVRAVVRLWPVSVFCLSRGRGRTGPQLPGLR